MVDNLKLRNYFMWWVPLYVAVSHVFCYIWFLWTSLFEITPG